MGRLKFGAWLLLCSATFLTITGSVLGIAVPPTPTDIPIVDQTNTLTTDQKATLAKLIADERTATSNQIAVLMIPTLGGDSLEQYSLDVARAWGIGEKEKNNGILLLIAKDDRRLRIEVGYGLEGALPDIRASQIMTSRIRPEFKNDRYFEGIQSGLVGIIAAIHDEYDPALAQSSATTTRNLGDLAGAAIYAIIFIPIWFASILARSKSWWAGGLLGALGGIAVGFVFGFLFIGALAIIVFILLGLIFDYFVSKNYNGPGGNSWWAGGDSFGGGSSGGFGGFGGGSFGGGGSSGSW